MIGNYYSLPVVVGGAAGDCCIRDSGYAGEIGTSGSNGGDHLNSGGTDGHPGQSDNGGGGGGAYPGGYNDGNAYQGDNGFNPLPLGGGGAYGDQPGGYGFGGGGAGEDNGGGGGGGYSGGGGGTSYGGGGGGGSYINTTYALSSTQYKQKNGREAFSAKDGYANYLGTNNGALPPRELKFYNTNKCIDLADSNAPNGAVVHLWDCYGGENQKWIWDGSKFHSKVNYNKCLDLNSANQANGTKIQIWDCVDTNGQSWQINNYTGQIKLTVNTNKCIDLEGGNTNNGTKIQIWDCLDGNANQIWSVQ